VPAGSDRQNVRESEVWLTNIVRTVSQGAYLSLLDGLGENYSLSVYSPF